MDNSAKPETKSFNQGQAKICPFMSRPEGDRLCEEYKCMAWGSWEEDGGKIMSTVAFIPDTWRDTDYRDWQKRMERFTITSRAQLNTYFETHNLDLDTKKDILFSNIFSIILSFFKMVRS